VVLEHYQAERKKQYTLDDGDELSIDYAQYLVNNLKNLGSKERVLHHPHLLKVCTTAALCHTMAAGFFAWPKEAEIYLTQGLSFKPDNISLLLIAETFYQTHPNPQKLSDIKARIKAMDVKKGTEDDVQDLIDRYTQLCNDYQYFSPSTNSKKTAPELLALEARLNAHWFGTLPEQTSMYRPIVEQQLIIQKRFLSSGSASIVGWMRNNGRYQKVVDYMMPLCTQLELCTLRHKANSQGFEAFLSNGLSCFLDSRDESHIPLGIQIMDAMESVIPEWEHEDIFYAFGCMAARAKQVDRAFRYIKKAIEFDKDIIQHMAQDRDFENIHSDPDFLILLRAS
jgi:hypothetical protein